MKPVLFILSGLPGTGKSTISRYIARKYNAAFLRIDTIEQGLRDLCAYDATNEGYGLACLIAAENLKAGVSVVADSCNPIPLTRKQWEEVALNNNCGFVNIEVVCSDKEEHRRRIEERVSDVSNLKLPTWREVEKREYYQWRDKRILIDTANKTIATVQKEVSEKVDLFFKEN